MRLVYHEAFEREGPFAVAKQLDAVVDGGADKLLRPPAHDVVLLRGHKINLQVSLEGVRSELLHVVGNLVSRIELGVDDVLRSVAEPAYGDFVESKCCAGCRVRTRTRIVDLLRGISADSRPAESCGTERPKVTTTLRDRDGLQLRDSSRLAKERLLVVGEEKQLVLDDGTAEGAAKVVIALAWPGKLVEVERPVVGIQTSAAKILVE